MTLRLIFSVFLVLFCETASARPRLIFTQVEPGTPLSVVTKELERKGYFRQSDFVHVDSNEALEAALFDQKNVIFDSTFQNDEFNLKRIERIHKTMPDYVVEVVAVKSNRHQRLKLPPAQVDRVVVLSPQKNSWVMSEVRKVARSSTIPSKFKTIVFDLDWTLFSPLFEKPAVMDWKVVFVEGQYYRAADYSDDILQALYENSEFKIATWSKGTRSRNRALLEGIKPPRWAGKSFYDVVEIAFSKEDLVHTADGEEKILSKVSNNHSNVILIDDQLQNITLSKGRGIALGKTLNFYENEEEVKTAIESGLVEPRYLPGDLVEWANERKRLVGPYEIVIQANARSKKGAKVFSEWVEILAAEPRDEFLRLGLQRLENEVKANYCNRLLSNPTP